MASCGRTWLRNRRVCPSVPGDGFVCADVVQLGGRGLGLTRLDPHPTHPQAPWESHLRSGHSRTDDVAPALDIRVDLTLSEHRVIVTLTPTLTVTEHRITKTSRVAAHNRM